ncbi:MAG: hypothetical protein K5894_12945 [Lachnospiraceae bacterium]|nr:hypothetical protein [Lachnospiraceae bacterium]
MKKIAIAVPIYRSELNSLEKISLTQLEKVLYSYDIYFVVPNSLDISKLVSETSFFEKRFPDSFFEGIESYSRLCTSKLFYEGFLDYEYLLIYQLDAFVFSDKLIFFYEHNYDYYGAPIPDRIWPYLKNKVGSGGVSLRKIEAVLRVLDKKDHIMDMMEKEYPRNEIEKTFYLEDRFFAYCGQRKDVQFEVPDIDLAFKFAVEFNVNGIYANIHKELPFACHKWYAENFDFWWPIVKMYGYSLNSNEIKRWTSEGAEHERWIICEEYAEGIYRDELRKFVLDMLRNSRVCIWGNGDIGKSAIKVLGELGITIEKVLDNVTNRYNSENTQRPTPEQLKLIRIPIIVCVKNAKKSIEMQLIKLNKRKNVDFFHWMEIERGIIERFKK